jgi:putative FmdB family regulatory protein
MPVYEYYCRDCEQKFELLRPMARAEEPVSCPQGHAGATRTISLFASIGRATESSFTPMSAGGCACGGGGCGCGH